MTAMNGTSEAWKTARLWQPLVCLSLLASIALSVATMEAVLHNEALAARVDREFADANDSANLYRRLYRDNEDRALLCELEELDVSRGGVYFFGGFEHDVGHSRARLAARRSPTGPQSRRRRRIVAAFRPPLR